MSRAASTWRQKALSSSSLTAIRGSRFHLHACEKDDRRTWAGLQPSSPELPADAHHGPAGACGDHAHACAGRRAERCAVGTRDLLGARAGQSRPVDHEAASARMSDSYHATPRLEMRTAFGYIPLFTPSYHVLRDTGMMRSTPTSSTRTRKRSPGSSSGAGSRRSGSATTRRRTGGGAHRT